MDLIYTDESHEDVGVLHDYTFDLAFGSNENDFELTLDVSNHCCTPNCFVYIEGTEYGGIIDKMKVSTKDDKLIYMGRTWHGILASKVLVPDSGKSHLTVSGDANDVIETLIKRMGLVDLFESSTDRSKLVVSNYSFDRYTDGYSGICKMLASVGGKLKFAFKNGKVILSAHPLVDYSQDEQFDNDQVEMTIEQMTNVTNHLICLGSGELENRQVIHLYADGAGNISDKQTFTGLQEIISVYDYANAESLDELRKGGIDKLKEYANKSKVQMDFPSEELIYDVGDIVGAKEITTGAFAREKIGKKIVTISKGLVNVQYKVGE